MKHRPSVPGSVSAQQVLPVIRALQELGYDGERALELAGLQHAQLAGALARVPCDAEFAVWDAAVEVSGDPLIGLRIAERVRTGDLAAYEYLLRSTANLRAALTLANRFMRVVDDLTRLSLFEVGTTARMRMWRDAGYVMPSESVECIFLVLVKIAKEQFPAFDVREVCLRNEPHGDQATYARYFATAVRFGAAYDELVFDRKLLDVPLARADVGLAAVLEAHVQGLLESLPDEDPFLGNVRRAMFAALGTGDVSLTALAKALHVSPRTLRRRLTECGVPYKTLLDEVRREVALREVARNIESLDALAERLGFSEASTFYRAFKRWTGTTPARYRADSQQRR
jgi:AraC-like DNA-binding protein